MRASTITAGALLVVALAGQALGGLSEQSKGGDAREPGRAARSSPENLSATSGRADGNERGQVGRHTPAGRSHSQAFWRASLRGQVAAKRAAQRKAHRLAQRVSRLRFELRETRRMLRGARKRLAEFEGGAGGGWSETSATSYSATKEWLTGCYAPGRCVMACGGELDDSAFTVASNPSLGLDCGTRIVVCDLTHRICRGATVTDRTASRFGLELSLALTYAHGWTGAAWDSPRQVRFRRA